METRRFPCPICAKPVDTDVTAAGKRVVCPHCNGLVNVPDMAAADWVSDSAVAHPPDAGQGGAGELVTPMEYPPRREPWIIWLSRLTSILLHAALLLGLAGVTWLEGDGSGGEGREVNIAETADAQDIGFDSPDLPDVQTQVDEAPAELTKSVDSVTSSDLDPSTGPDTAASAVEVLTGLAPPAGSSDGLPDVAPRSGFFGIEERGRKLAYVVDYSGSMYDQVGDRIVYVGDPPKLAAAKRELITSVKKLSPLHLFIVLFYSDGFEPMPGGKLSRATAANKRKVIRWIEAARGGGGTSPTGAMQHVLNLKPDAVWLLSDGIFEDPVCGAIAMANRDVRARIHAIAFFDNDGEPVLRRIARENEGTFRFVSPRSIGLRSRNP